MSVSKDDIIKLRAETSAGVMDARKALEQARGDFDQAKELLHAWGADKAAKKAERATGAGVVETYVHGAGKIGVMVELACETDFVAKTDQFKELAHDVALQISAMDPQTVEELLAQEFIKDPGKTIGELVTATIATTGENIQIKRFTRYVLGQE